MLGKRGINVLYYLEPWIELDFPHFRLGTVRNHLQHEIRTLKAAGAKPALIMGRAVADAAKREKLIDADTPVFVIEQADLRRAFPNYVVAANAIYNNRDTASQLGIIDLIQKAVFGKFDPDVVIAYECASAVVRKAFPKKLVLDSTLGMFSREPFPETFCLDPCGSFKDSWLAQHGAQISAQPVSNDASEFMQRLRSHYLDGIISAHNPIKKKQVRKGFDKVVLLPLQVSPYFAFDNNADRAYSSQFDYLCNVMEQVSPDTGVFVTEHGFQQVITDRNRKWLKDRFGNLIFDEDLRKHRWLSQFALEHVDGVITVSSAVGLLGAFAQKPVCVLGRSHLTAVAASNDVASFTDNLANLSADRDGLLHYLLTRYYPMTERHLHNETWFPEFLRRGLEKHEARTPLADFFDPIEDSERLLATYLGGAREQRMIDNIKKSKHTAPARARPAKKKVKAPDVNALDMTYVRQRIDQAQVVSFDIFDTLVARTFADYQMVWDAVALRGRDLLSGARIPVTDFKESRKKAGRRALEHARSEGHEDTTLRDIYNEFRKMHELPKETAGALRRLECDIEFSCIRRRESIRQLYDYAVEKGKRVFLTSDMYMDADFVEHLVAANGYKSHEALLLSSIDKKLKKTGALFDVLIERCGVKPSRILHMGDNALSDVKMARAKGIEAIHLPKQMDAMMLNEAHRDVWANLPDTLGKTVWQGIVGKLFDDPSMRFRRDTLFNGSAYNLGLTAGGPIMVGFATWLLNEAKEKGIDTLYFLARDGWHVKAAYDAVAETVTNAPKSVYLYASRRACSTASLCTANDIQDSLDLAFSKVTVGNLLRDRFDLDLTLVSDSTLKDAGLAGLDAVVTSKKPEDLERIRDLLKSLTPMILDKAATEREAYTAYLRDNGLYDDEKRIAIVDIGHNGTLQQALSKMLDRQMGGYYFATFTGARKLVEQGLDVSSYLLTFEENRNSEHYYCRNIGMFEFLFLPPERSFRRMTVCPTSDTGYQPEFVELDESVREDVAREVGRGIEAFIAEAKKSLGPLLPSFDLEAEEVTSIFAAYVTQPSRHDAKIVENLSFADAFGGNAARYLIATPLYEDYRAQRGDFLRDSWWRNGANAFLNHGAVSATTGRKSPQANPQLRKLRKLVKSPRRFIADSSMPRKLRKLVRSPKRFFADAALNKKTA